MTDPADEILMATADAIKRGALAMWTIYDHPADYPDGFIARMHEVATKGGTHPTSKTLKGELDELRQLFWRAGLLKVTRHPQDEPQIVETWV